jgi:hypothetical protein
MLGWSSWQLVGFIRRRSQVRVLSPQPYKIMTATTQHLTIEQGVAFSQAIAVGDDYDDLQPTAQIRDRFNGRLVADLTCSVVAAGSTTVSLTAAQTAALCILDDQRPDLREALLGQWDLVTTVRHVQGRVTLSRSATI